MNKLEKFVDENIKELLSNEEKGINVWKMLEANILDTIDRASEKILTEAFGITVRGFRDIEIYERDFDKFRDSRIGKFIFGEVQDKIIKNLESINPEAVVEIIKKAVKKNFNEQIEYKVEEIIQTHIKNKLQESVTEKVEKILKERIDKLVDLNINNYKNKKKTSNKPKVSLFKDKK